MIILSCKKIMNTAIKTDLMIPTSSLRYLHHYCCCCILHHYCCCCILHHYCCCCVLHHYCCCCILHHCCCCCILHHCFFLNEFRVSYYCFLGIEPRSISQAACGEITPTIKKPFELQSCTVVMVSFRHQWTGITSLILHSWCGHSSQIR